MTFKYKKTMVVSHNILHGMSDVAIHTYLQVYVSLNMYGHIHGPKQANCHCHNSSRICFFNIQTTAGVGYKVSRGGRFFFPLSTESQYCVIMQTVLRLTRETERTLSDPTK